MLKFISTPKEIHLTQIKNWLIEEWNKKNEGFLVQWDLIEKSFYNNDLLIFSKDNEAIGFIVYTQYTFSLSIDILEIKPCERKKGIAKKFTSEVFKYFKSKKTLVIELFCEPKSSESFWKRIGFLNFPKSKRDNRIRMYKTLIEHQEDSLKKSNTTLKLWFDEPHRTKDKEPNKIWNINFLDDGENLKHPIIFPVEYDWKIELFRNNVKIVSNKIKRFLYDSGDFEGFLIVKKITLPPTK